MFKTKFIAVALALLLGGCSAAIAPIKGAVSNDLNRTAELASKYGKPEVKQCADFLNTSLNSQDSVQGKIDALLAEDTDGILSNAFKAYLIAELVKSLNDPAVAQQLQKDFDANCRAVAGQVFINLVRDARKGALKSKGL